VLQTHTGQLTQLIQDGNLLLTELNDRRQQIHDLLDDTVEVTNQLVDFSAEQRDRLRPTLDELNHTIGILRHNQDNIVISLQRVSAFITSLGEGVSYGPWFTGEADLGGLAFFPTAQFIPGLATPKPPPNPPVQHPLPSLGGLIGEGGNGS
jgi:phospholipid/cholesterol/gamma-HCH transport system substrate-binding protein